MMKKVIIAILLMSSTACGQEAIITSSASLLVMDKQVSNLTFKSSNTNEYRDIPVTVKHSKNHVTLTISSKVHDAQMGISWYCKTNDEWGILNVLIPCLNATWLYLPIQFDPECKEPVIRIEAQNAPFKIEATIIGDKIGEIPISE